MKTSLLFSGCIFVAGLCTSKILRSFSAKESEEESPSSLVAIWLPDGPLTDHEMNDLAFSVGQAVTNALPEYPEDFSDMKEEAVVNEYLKMLQESGFIPSVKETAHTTIPEDPPDNTHPVGVPV